MAATLTPDAFRREVIAGVTSAVDDLIREEQLVGSTHETVETAVAALVDTIRERQYLADRFGAFYSIDRVRELLGGISRQAVADRVARRRLLRVRTADDRLLFPAFQFQGGRVHPRVAKIVSLLGRGTDDGWTIAYWFTSPLEQFGGRTARTVAFDGRPDEIERLERLAVEDSTAWVLTR